MLNLWKSLQRRFGKRTDNPQAAVSNRLADDEPESCEPVAYDIVTSFLSDIGCQREINEDQGRYITPGDPEVLADKGMLFIVADGMGGHSGGEVASRLAVEVIGRAYYEETAGTQDALKKAILEANDAIYSEAYKNRKLLGMGTTCTALVIQNAQAFAAQIGDSRLYLVRDDVIYLMTEDHSLAMQLVNRGLLSLDQARHHPEKNVILRALGSHPMVEVATWKNPFPVRLGDKFVLCSDGLYDLVEDEEIRQAVAERDAHRACGALIDLAKGRGGHDNITVGIVYVVTKSAGEEKAVRPTREVEVLQ